MQRIHYLLEKYNESVIDIVYVDSVHQISDILTKPICESQFIYLRNLLLGMINSEEMIWENVMEVENDINED